MSLWRRIQERFLGKSEKKTDLAFEYVYQSNNIEIEYRPRAFYVSFSSAPKHIWSPLLRKHFQHVFVSERLEYIWMVYDPSREGLNVMLPNCDAEHPLAEVMMGLDPSMVVLEVNTYGNDKPYLLRPRIMSCVTICEYLMGLNFVFCFTPYQLYKRLLKGTHKNILSVKELKNGNNQCTS